MSIETAVCGAHVRRAVEVAIGFGLRRLLRPAVALWGGHGRGVATLRDGQRLLACGMGPFICAMLLWTTCADCKHERVSEERQKHTQYMISDSQSASL